MTDVGFTIKEEASRVFTVGASIMCRFSSEPRYRVLAYKRAAATQVREGYIFSAEVTIGDQNYSAARGLQ